MDNPWDHVIDIGMNALLAHWYQVNPKDFYLLQYSLKSDKRLLFLVM